MKAYEDTLKDGSECPTPTAAGPPPQLLATAIPAPAAIALDEQRVWFTAYAGGSIGSVPRDGSAAPEVFVEGIAFPTGIAVDDISVYVATASGTIFRIDRHTRVRTELVTHQARPHDLLRIDDRLYWANEGTAGGTLHEPVFNHNAGFFEMALDAEVPRTLLEGEDWARGLVVAEGVAYGAVSSPERGHRIMAVPLDDQPARIVATVGGAIRGVAVHGGYVYWTRPLACAIRRAPVHGGPVESVATGENVPQMIGADDSGLVWTNAGSLSKDFAGSQVVTADANGGGRQVIAAGRNAFVLVATDLDVFFSNNDLEGDIARASRF